MTGIHDTISKRRIRIVDTTLRDGEQAPGVRFSLPRRIAIAEQLADAGVDGVEAGIPVSGREAADGVRAVHQAISGSYPGIRVSSWCRARMEDLLAAVRTGTGAVHIGFPLSDRILSVVNRDRQWIFDTLESLVPFARIEFDFVSVGMMDAFRTDPADVAAFLSFAAGLGVDRVRIADTVGVATPLSIAELFARIASAPGHTKIEFHAHNDLGMAVANAVTAAQCGADAVSVTVNGLGERAGNAALESVAAALGVIPGLTTGIRTDRLPTLCRLVADASGREIPPDRPVVGGAAFTHESGIHVAGLLKDPLSFQPFLPETVGREGMRFTYGPQSGRAALAHAMAESGVRNAGPGLSGCPASFSDIDLAERM